MRDLMYVPDNEREAEEAEARVEVLTVDPASAGVRLDRYLSDNCDLTRAAAVRLIEAGEVTLVSGEGKGRRSVKADKNTKLRGGDEVTVTYPAPEEYDVAAEDIPLDVVYEDSDIIVVNKPVGMVVHPAAGNPDGTLVNALLHYCGEDLSGIGGELRPGIVHRIDKDTSGLLVVAKNDFTHRGLSEQLSTHGVSRVYYALANGGFRAETGTVDAPIGRHPRDRKKMAVLRDGHSAKDAVTHYEVLAQYGAISYLKLRLETGRTHQIRVHMASLGHPLLGDTLYGGGHTRFEREHAPLMQGQCLHAGELSFVHPRTGEEMHFECPLPPYFEKLLHILDATH